jgi:hypothetical protein
MPVAPVVDAAESVSGPDHNMRHAHTDVLLAARTQVRALSPRTGDRSHEPLATGIPGPLRDAAGDPREVERGTVVTASVGAGHERKCPTSGSIPADDACVVNGYRPRGAISRCGTLAWSCDRGSPP